jgi:hypothetical protein
LPRYARVAIKPLYGARALDKLVFVLRRRLSKKLSKKLSKT